MLKAFFHDITNPSPCCSEVFLLVEDSVKDNENH